MPSPPSIIIGLQGIFGILNGFGSLIFPSAAQKNAVTLEISSIPAIHAIALGSLSIGAFYVITAYKNDRLAMHLTIAGRALAVGIFWIDDGPWKNVAIFEGVCGLVLSGAMLWESWTETAKQKTV